jgi:hypothetical protein
MRFFLVFCKTRKKFDKFVKINKIRGKIIIDIKEQLEDESIDYLNYKDYFNLLIWTKIRQAANKGKDIYYIPNLHDENYNINELLKIKNTLKKQVEFDLILFFDDIKDTSITDDVISNLSFFSNSQIIKDY